jgi:hypothetical protein
MENLFNLFTDEATLITLFWIICFLILCAVITEKPPRGSYRRYTDDD